MTEATVTISADEYFHLREQAEMNIYLTRELSEIKTFTNNIEMRLYQLEREVEKGASK